MSSWPTQSLGEICIAKSGNSKIIKGTLSQHNDGTLFPAYSATGQDVFSDGYDFEGDGIVISAVGARCGKCFLASGKWRAIANTHVILPRPNKVNVKFLWYMLNDESFWIRGGTAQPFVKVLDSLKKQVAVPPLGEQERIVEILDQSDSLRRLRTQADRRADALIPALFHETFGDGQSFPTKPLVELVDSDRGISYGVVQRGNHFPGGVPLLRISNFGKNQIDSRDLVSVDPNISAQFKRTVLIGGELVVSIRGTVGRIAIVPNEAEGWNVAREVAVVPLLPDVSRPFMHAYMLSQFAQDFITGEIRGIAQRGINLEDLRRLPVPLPPRALQREFAERVTDIRKLEAIQTTSRLHLDSLFGSVLHRAFAGEL